MSNRPFAVNDHMVQKPPCWRANYPLGHPKQKHIKLSYFVLDVPVGSLLSSMAVFAPCDRKLQRAYCFQFAEAQVNVFVLTAFEYIHSPLTSLEIVNELSTLLCYEVIALNFK